MKIVIQRVSHASVSINGEVHSQIQQGFLVLVGFTDSDSLADVDRMASKIVSVRIFADNEGKMNWNIKQVYGSLLVVSQFTLYAETQKGNRPSFIKAAKPEIAIPLYEYFLGVLEKELPNKVHSGVFGADMKITLTNDGPVTIVMDSKNQVDL
jgi:D-aminoacyl-tRNA deacylase